MKIPYDITDEELAARGYAVATYRAIQHAGGFGAVAQAFGYKQNESVHLWCRPGKRIIPAEYIADLCKMGKNKVKPALVLAEAAQRKAS